MNYEELEKTLDTGDLILFQDNWWLGNMISYFTNSDYSHCGVIVKDPDLLVSKSLDGKPKTTNPRS